jgi:hypothetical protein
MASYDVASNICQALGLGTPTKRARGATGGRGNGGGEAAARRGEGVSGPVGEWLKAEGEARMKMADHRRLIYRWTNAIYRLLGMKIPRGRAAAQIAQNVLQHICQPSVVEWQCHPPFLTF